MGFLGAEIDGPVVVARAVHFAATALLAGALVFRAVVADPALRGAGESGAVVDARIRRLAWMSLAVSLISGGVWLLLLAASMSGQTWGEAIVSGTLLAVLGETQFGQVSEIRLALVVLLALCLSCDRYRTGRWLALGAAVCLVGSIAWTGHAGSTPYRLGYLHLAADALHLAAAAAWTGGLASLLLLLHALAHSGAEERRLDAIRRFSALGVLSVATLIVTGIVNAWILVGSFRALFVTEYGSVLTAKLALFVVMIAFAAVNRFWLTPRLALRPNGVAVRWLERNTTAEIVLALIVFAVVGVLGTLHPAAHLIK
jgi:putative copper resistance protein D